jgi:hypothetical protein
MASPEQTAPGSGSTAPSPRCAKATRSSCPTMGKSFFNILATFAEFEVDLSLGVR